MFKGNFVKNAILAFVSVYMVKKSFSENTFTYSAITLASIIASLIATKNEDNDNDYDGPDFGKFNT